MILETDKIRIELSNPANISRIMEIERDNSEFVGQYDYDRHKQVIKDEDEIHFSIFDKSDSLLIGYIILAGLIKANDSIEFRRIVISRKGCGFGKESICLIKSYCFDKLNTNQIWLDVYTENIRAIKLYTSEGFRTEKTKNYQKDNGKMYSLNIMTLKSRLS